MNFVTVAIFVYIIVCTIAYRVQIQIQSRVIEYPLNVVDRTVGGGMSSEGLDVLLSFHVSQGHVANILRTIKLIQGIYQLLLTPAVADTWME